MSEESVHISQTCHGIHHISAISSDARQLSAFYRGVLGLGLVKRTVNFDAPTMHHLYFGDAAGRPGTLMTTFPWPGARQGRAGAGAIAGVAFAASGSVAAGIGARLEQAGIAVRAGERFGRTHLAFEDPDGMSLTLDTSGEDAPGGARLGGFALMSRDPEASAAFFREHFSFDDLGSEGGVRRLCNGSTHIDLLPSEGEASMGAGSIHHVAFRVADIAAQDALAEKLHAAGVPTTEPKDRLYFRSIYLREPGGAICEIATDGPGFAIDEPLDGLGHRLTLPPWLEPRRGEIEASLPELD